MRNGSLPDFPCVCAWPNPYKTGFVGHPDLFPTLESSHPSHHRRRKEYRSRRSPPRPCDLADPLCVCFLTASMRLTSPMITGTLVRTPVLFRSHRCRPCGGWGTEANTRLTSGEPPMALPCMSRWPQPSVAA
jgi:hypothetical protein